MADSLDVVIIGSGPAAMSAALYAARDQRRVLVLEKASMGGLTGIISEIENYPGFVGSGESLMALMRKQAESFGARFEYGECTSLAREASGLYRLVLDGDEDEAILAPVVIIATGTLRNKLGIPGEDLPGVSYCATCDAPLARGKDVIVVGGGNSAAQEALYLLNFCPRVTMLVRSELRCDEILKKRLSGEGRITIVRGCVPREIHQASDDQLLLRSESGNEYLAGRIFIFIGSKPATEFVPEELLAPDLSVRTDADYMTKYPGLFAVGDCRSGAVRQSIVAAGEGAAAAVHAREFLENLQH